MIFKGIFGACGMLITELYINLVLFDILTLELIPNKTEQLL